MNDTVSIVRADGEGERLSFWGGGLLTMKLTGAESAGALLIFEDQMVRGKMTPLHIHEHEDETLYVLEGEILVHIAGVEHRVGGHGVAFVPRGIPHAFFVSSETARVITIENPASAEAFYRAASRPAAADADPSDPVDFGKVREAAERIGGMKVVGPPPFKAAMGGA